MRRLTKISYLAIICCIMFLLIHVLFCLCCVYVYVDLNMFIHVLYDAHASISENPRWADIKIIITFKMRAHKRETIRTLESLIHIYQEYILINGSKKRLFN